MPPRRGRIASLPPIYVSGLVDPGGISRSHDLATRQQAEDGHGHGVFFFVVILFLVRTRTQTDGMEEKASVSGWEKVATTFYVCVVHLLSFLLSSAPWREKGVSFEAVPHTHVCVCVCSKRKPAG